MNVAGNNLTKTCDVEEPLLVRKVLNVSTHVI